MKSIDQIIQEEISKLKHTNEQTVHNTIKEEVERHLLEQYASTQRQRPVPAKVEKPYCVTDAHGKRCFLPPSHIKPSIPMTAKEREISDRESLVDAIKGGYFNEDEMRTMRAKLEGFGIPEVDFSRPADVPDEKDYTDLLDIADLARVRNKENPQPDPEESPGLRAVFGKGPGQYTLIPTRVPK